MSSSRTPGSPVGTSSCGSPPTARWPPTWARPTAPSSRATGSRPPRCSTATPSPSAAPASCSGTPPTTRRVGDPMTELAITLLRLSYLALLWIFVIGALVVLRRDIFGTRVTRRAGGSGRSRQPPARSGQRPARGTPTRLVVTEGPLTGTTLPLGPSAVVVGRSPAATLVLDDDYSSGRHARFFPKDGAWWVEDLGSTNGTFVQDRRLTQPVRLAAGTPVRVGQTVIELQR